MFNPAGHSTRNIREVLQQYWGFSSFRPGQEEIIQQVLAGNDTLALMPTGGGKSLCYQVPAMAAGGLCLVISPLVALMKDQVENLRKKGITAYAIYAGMSRKEVLNIFRVAAGSNCRFLYVSPERLETSLFREYLPSLPVQLIAVDEAHCISQWGYDFRPPYLRIASIREELPGVPVLALTASATPAVQKDICEKLGTPEPGKNETFWEPGLPAYRGFHIFRQSFERPQLSYSVFSPESKISKISEILQKVPGSSIIYCRSRKRTKEISDLLRLQQVSADYYHAGLEPEERNRKQEDWMQNRTRVMVCTNAFGMGIDKPEVRTVIHADVPDSLESYYQEAGRAGRDGKRAYAVLLYTARDRQGLEEQASLRFPAVKEIQQVYQSVANYLQLPSNSGAGLYYDFDFPDFTRKFSLAAPTALYALKLLEQEGWLSFSEQVFLPAMAGFTTGKETLYRFEKEHPELEPLIKTLLRSCEGIYDQPVAVSEKMIAGLMRLDPGAVARQLEALQQYGILSYRPQKDLPQLLLLRNRVKAEELTLDSAAIRARKEQLMARLRQMLQYIEEPFACRSRLIGIYFGDTELQPCGICDNCLRRNATPLSREEFETVQQQVLRLLRPEALPVKLLLQELGTVKKEKAWKVLEQLQAENILHMDGDGKVSLRHP